MTLSTTPTSRATSADSADVVMDALMRTGYVIVDGLVDAEVVNETRSEIDRELANVSPSTVPEAGKPELQALYTSGTKRLGGLVGRSRASWKLAQHELVLQICDKLLLPNCDRYRLHATLALVVGPGAGDQGLHREEIGYRYFSEPRPPLVLQAIWALSDFTSNNGATRVVPGSHEWSLTRTQAPAGSSIQATMGAGSLLLFLGRTLHGAAANNSDTWRYAASISYSLGWLRTEECQYRAIPSSVVEKMPKELTDLLGYCVHGPGLGYADLAELQ